VAPETPLAPVPGAINAKVPCVSTRPISQPLVLALCGKVKVTVPVVGDFSVTLPCGLVSKLIAIVTQLLFSIY
jgi:hypothetical protein